jgi:RHS repeat-associated protein
VRYQGAGCAQRFVEQYSYTAYGAMTKKRVKMIRGAASGVLESVAEYDGEGRLPNTLTNTTDSVTVVTSVSYGVAGEMTTFVSGGGTETRSYNVNGQMTTLNLPGRTVTYNFPAAGSNNGKVSSVVDSGETISYLYDSLQRLTSASGSGWSQTFSYDGFGNMTGKVGTGGAPSWSGAIDPATNRLSGVSFDANGNQLALPMTSGMPDVFTATYDVSNRMIYVENPTQSRRSWYEYDPGNKRIYEKRVDGGGTQEWFHYFGITGQRLARYSFTVSGAVITFAEHENSVWFGGKLVRNAGSWTNEDRLGSVGKYLPYGEDKPGATNPANDSVKFATYTRDSGTGVDYADQRWHAQGVGRFLTSDPYEASAGPEDPASWNRYGYVRGDPTNFIDRRGLLAQVSEEWACDGLWSDSFDCWGGDPQGGFPMGSGLACFTLCIDINGPSNTSYSPVFIDPSTGVPLGLSPLLPWIQSWSADGAGGLTISISGIELTQELSNSLVPILAGGVILAGETAAGGTVIAWTINIAGAISLGYVVDKIIEAVEKSKREKARCKKVKKDCMDACVATLPTGRGSGKRYFRCVAACMLSSGCHPGELYELWSGPQ